MCEKIIFLLRTELKRNFFRQFILAAIADSRITSVTIGSGFFDEPNSGKNKPQYRLSKDFIYALQKRGGSKLNMAIIGAYHFSTHTHRTFGETIRRYNLPYMNIEIGKISGNRWHAKVFFANSQEEGCCSQKSEIAIIGSSNLTLRAFGDEDVMCRHNVNDQKNKFNYEADVVFCAASKIADDICRKSLQLVEEGINNPIGDMGIFVARYDREIEINKLKINEYASGNDSALHKRVKKYEEFIKARVSQWI